MPAPAFAAAKSDVGGNQAPASFGLEQNYPNPFNPSTEISFSLSEQTHVKLEVFNLLGQRVSTLADEEYPAGRHTVNWDASKQASGVYFYRISTKDGVDARRMMLLK
ncbi:MAG: T9SS type A sorting domain-containing protein [candidate division Zixibacteria bacterium]|nr:T9SS type A sorting domain-containing protein [candidate division Zixibacteria bacterium]NIS16307.1 T9SS type A sorting domain-containing protein [candidate division Zixibacteria bacterium]NIS46281.1 T9SS type A sorting domain-containing protein [candidate division Zixibacteria bacterium]NIT54489.1 T9SS type A sorting domain-containing protein [candidate division Zixibacteria bacterium]NIU14371.1 T9SS type A sorting domain-containing protein [candidate division Zixibacteria bacterium]